MRAGRAGAALPGVPGPRRTVRTTHKPRSQGALTQGRLANATLLAHVWSVDCNAALYARLFVRALQDGG